MTEIVSVGDTLVISDHQLVRIEHLDGSVTVKFGGWPNLDEDKERCMEILWQFSGATWVKPNSMIHGVPSDSDQHSLGSTTRMIPKDAVSDVPKPVAPPSQDSLDLARAISQSKALNKFARYE